MVRRRNSINKLKLEMLESRVMLATGDSTVEPPLATGWETAVQTSDPAVTANLLPYNRVLIISGSDDGHVTVDLSGLPSSVVILRISHFETVTLTGNAKLESLVLTDVDFADAGAVQLDSLFTFGVDHVKIDQAPAQVLLQGANGIGSVGESTLLEADQFSSDPQASIFALVRNLGLATPSEVTTLPQLIRHDSQVVYLNFTPENPVPSNSTSPVNVITGTDFTEYFFATPEERAVLDASPTVGRSLALVQHLSLVSMWSNPELQAALGSALDFGGNSHSRPPAESPIQDLRWQNSEADTPVAVAPETNGTAHEVTASDTELPSLANNEPAGVTTWTDSAPRREVHSAPTDSFNFILPTSTAEEAQVDGAVGALAAALARMSEPFVQTVVGLQGRFASFGDIVSAQVTDHMRNDGRPMLLADARPFRHRQDGNVVVVNV